MSTARVLLRPRAPRPHLSTRYRILRRAHSSNTAAPPPPPGPSFLKRHFSKILWSWLGGLVGVAGGTFVVHTVAPPALPDAGTREDGVLLADLDRRIDEEFKVKVLRGKCLGVAKQLRGDAGGWLEVIGVPRALAPAEEEKDGGLLQASMQGAKGTGVERVFWERGEKKLVAVVWFGGSLCGWPGVTHGGALATALADKSALAALLLAQGSATDVLAAATPQRLPGTGNHAKMLHPAATPDEPTHLSLTYVKPTYANQFYVIRVSPASDDLDDGPEFEATLETLDAKVCVRAKTRFRPGGSNTARQADTTGRRSSKTSSYAEFKEWLWPSRQRQASQIE